MCGGVHTSFPFEGRAADRAIGCDDQVLDKGWLLMRNESPLFACSLTGQASEIVCEMRRVASLEKKEDGKCRYGA